jgi:hypothetical protein
VLHLECSRNSRTFLVEMYADDCQRVMARLQLSSLA